MTDKRARAQGYMLDVAKRIDRVLDLTGRHPGPLAKLYCSNFVGCAKQAGRTRDEATRLLHETWERFDKFEAQEELDAKVKSS